MRRTLAGVIGAAAGAFALAACQTTTSPSHPSDAVPHTIVLGATATGTAPSSLRLGAPATAEPIASSALPTTGGFIGRFDGPGARGTAAPVPALGATAGDRIADTALGAPVTFSATASTSTVSLLWAPPPSGSPVTSYVVEAGSAPGLSDLANFNTGNTSTYYIAYGVPNGTYYVRARAKNAAGTSAPSNEARVDVGTAPPSTCSLPNVPALLLESRYAPSLYTLIHSVSPGDAFDVIILEAGSANGLANLARMELSHDRSGWFTASNGYSIAGSTLAAGTYYIRIRVKNSCGESVPSNTVVFTIPGASAPAPTPAPTTCASGSNGRLSVVADDYAYIYINGIGYIGQGIVNNYSLRPGNYLVYARRPSTQALCWQGNILVNSCQTSYINNNTYCR